MADKYEAIFDALVKKNVEAYHTDNFASAAEMYDAHAVVIDTKNGKSFYGTEQLKLMIDGYMKMGKADFKITRKDIHAVGGDRFFVDADFESKIIASGVEMKGSIYQLFQQQNGQWKCVYERFDMQ